MPSNLTVLIKWKLCSEQLPICIIPTCLIEEANFFKIPQKSVYTKEISENKFLRAHSQKVGTIIEKFKFRQTHVRMGLKPHATYGEKDAKAPSSRICALLVKAYIVNNKHIGY